jgi:hypothetical protein
MVTECVWSPTTCTSIQIAGFASNTDELNDKLDRRGFRFLALGREPRVTMNRRCQVGGAAVFLEPPTAEQYNSLIRQRRRRSLHSLPYLNARKLRLLVFQDEDDEIFRCTRVVGNGCTPLEGRFTIGREPNDGGPS